MGPGADGGSSGPVNVQPTWRLTNAEYANTVRDLLGLSATAPLDPDGPSGGFNAGLVAGDAAVRAYHSSAVALAAQAVGKIATLVPCTAADMAATPAVCASKFIDAIGPKAYRRPLDAETKKGLNDLYATMAAQFGFQVGIQAIVEEILQSPYFLYHLELEEQALGAGKVAVSGYSMASRLSYLLWASMPDDALFSKAAANQLSTIDQIQAEATRMVAHANAKGGLRNFYQQWLAQGALPLQKTGKYAASFTSAARDSVRASFEAQVDAALWSASGGLTSLLSGKQAFVDVNTAPLFGVQGVTGTALQPVMVNDQRAGILMPPAIMATFATENGSHPIKRGVFVWDQILCEPLPDPPPDVPTFPGVSGTDSVRQAYEKFTSPALCQGCHVRINPVGFLFESYDTLGAYRTTDDNGRPVNSQVTIVGARDDTLNIPTTNAVELATRLGKSDETVQCLVRQIYRYATRRQDSDADAPIIESIASQFNQSGQSVKQLLGALTETDAFSHRLNEP